MSTSVLIATGTGSFYDRVGVLARFVRALNGVVGQTPTTNAGSDFWGTNGPSVFDLNTAVNNIFAQYESTDQNLASLAQLALSAIRQSAPQANQIIANICATTLQQMCNDELVTNNPTTTPPGNYLQSLSNALSLLAQQMQGTGAIGSPTYGFQQPTVSVSAAVYASPNLAPTGTFSVVASILNGGGLQEDYTIPETLVTYCTGDQNGNQSSWPATNYSGTALAVNGSEPMTIYAGQYSGASSLDWTMTNPLGPETPSGASATFIICDPTLNQIGGTGSNVLNNSSFGVVPTTTANLPDFWAVATPSGYAGAVGTEILVNTTTAPVLAAQGGTAAAMTYSLAFVGTTNKPEIVQAFNTAGLVAGTPSPGTGYALLPATQYAVSFWVKTTCTSSGTLSAGVLEVSLVGSDKTTVLTNAAGASLLKHVTLSVSTQASWTQYTAFFQTPSDLGSAQYLAIRLSTAITTSAGVATIYISDVAMCLATPVSQQQANGGTFYVAAFRGATDAVAGDAWTVTTANNYRTAAVFALMMNAFFGLGRQGIQLPSKSSTPTWAETLCN